MGNTNAKNLIIKDGMTAVFHDKNKVIPITLINVIKDDFGICFNAINNTNKRYVMGKHGIMKWNADYAINSKTIILDNPIYDDDEVENTTIKVDPLEEKRNLLRSYFTNHIKFLNKKTGLYEKFVLDDEQLNAVLSDTNTLVTARAGSGKTRVLIAKLIYLFEKKGLNENNVYAFCFNRDANIEISNRLNNQCKVDNDLKYMNYDIAKTFHSFSKNSIARNVKILEDKN